MNLDFLTAGGLCYICGSFTNNSTETANVLISQEMLDSIHELHEAEPTYLYTRCDFTLDPAQNFRINEFREVAEKLGYEIANRITFRDRHTGRKWE